jgi:hypothetical protein
MSAYFETLEAHNEAQGNGGKQLSAADAERLRKFNAAHGVAV